MAEPDPNPAGLFASLRRLLDNTLALVQNRLELFALELKEEKCRFIEILVWASAVILLGVMAVMMVTLTVVFLFWESARVFVLAGFCLLYVLGAIAAFVGLRRRLKNQPLPFAESLNEIKKDRECLQPRS